MVELAHIIKVAIVLLIKDWLGKDAHRLKKAHQRGLVTTI
jgi:hypothetical protein